MEFLRILGKEWKIRTDQPSLLGHPSHGHVLLNAQEIVVSLDQHEDQQLDTLLHEAIHVLDHSLNIGLDERQVHALAGSLMCLLRDNPWFAAKLASLEIEDESAS